MTGWWPGEYRSAVLVTVVVDGERALLARNPDLAGSEKTLSTAHYGLKHGLPAVVEILDEANMPVSWLMPGSILRAHPEVASFVRRGDDVGLRGDDLERLDSLPSIERRSRLTAAIAAARSAGIEPSGFRLAGGDWPQGLADELLSLGIQWSSSWVADDLPFTLLGESGRSLVELPYHHVNVDRQAFDWNFAPAVPAGHSRIASYAETAENWRWEFEGSREEGLLWVLTLHPDIVGTPGRRALLRTILSDVRAKDDVWVASASEIAAWWSSQGFEPRNDHSSRVFLRGAGWSGY